MHTARPISIFATLTAIAGLVAVGNPGVAEAVTPGHLVTADSSAGTVSWATPPLVTHQAYITNTTDSSGTSTVITLTDSAAPTNYASHSQFRPVTPQPLNQTAAC
jgi:hypothetical protein